MLFNTGINSKSMSVKETEQTTKERDSMSDITFNFLMIVVDMDAGSRKKSQKRELRENKLLAHNLWLQIAVKL